jgi:hypothetical protein
VQCPATNACLLLTYCCLRPAGKRMLVARANGDGATVLQLWSSSKLLKELTVPKAQHGAVINDGWFSRGAAWSSDESKVVYVAEVGGGAEACWACGTAGWLGVVKECSPARH